MKVIIAGSRSITDYNLVVESVKESGFNIEEIVSGGARGVDTLGERYARENNRPLKIFPANWDKCGKSAGYLRNIEMAVYADALIAIWDGESKGTQHMINIANENNLKVYKVKI